MLLLYPVALFYLVTGVYAARVLLRYAPLEQALDLIEATPRPFWLRHQTTWLASGSLIIALGALLLLFRLDLALYVTVFAVAQQAFYLYWLAPRKIDPHDPPDPAGRKATHTAFLGYSTYALAVTWAFGSGHLRTLSGLSLVELALAAACGIGWLGYSAWLLRAQARL